MKTINGFDVIATQEEINIAIELLGDEFTKEQLESALSDIRVDIAKSLKLPVINAEYEQNVLNIANVGKDEMATWPKQEAEARAWLSDNNSATPVIDNLLIGRTALGESKAELVAKIIANTDAYSIAFPKVLGLHQAKQKALQACTTVAEVELL